MNFPLKLHDRPVGQLMRLEERSSRSADVAFSLVFRSNHEERVRHAQTPVYAHGVFEIWESLRS